MTKVPFPEERTIGDFRLGGRNDDLVTDVNVNNRLYNTDGKQHAARVDVHTPLQPDWANESTNTALATSNDRTAGVNQAEDHFGQYRHASENTDTNSARKLLFSREITQNISFSPHS
jgi:hypothetical protein